MAAGGLKSNVLPPTATALVNHRVHPAESVADVVRRDARAAGAGIAVCVVEPLEPAPVAAATHAAPGWRAVTDALAAVFPDAVAVEGLMLGNNDTQHYWSLARDIYRHCPVSLHVDETKMFHGKNERIAVAQLPLLATFYVAVVMAGAGE